MEAQNSQVEILKNKCKKLLDEKRQLEENVNHAKNLIAENKANEIIYQETRNQKKVIEENAKKLTQEIKELSMKNKSMETTVQTQTEEIEDLKKTLMVVDEQKTIDMEQLQSKVEEYRNKSQNLEEIVTQFRKNSHSSETTEEITESIVVIEKKTIGQEENLKKIEELQKTMIDKSTDEEQKVQDISIECLHKTLEEKDQEILKLISDIEKQDEEKNNLEQM